MAMNWRHNGLPVPLWKLLELLAIVLGCSAKDPGRKDMQLLFEIRRCD